MPKYSADPGITTWVPSALRRALEESRTEGLVENYALGQWDALTLVGGELGHTRCGKPLATPGQGEATSLHDPASCSRMARMRACSSLDEVRTCIDAVDRQIIKLIAERRGYVLQASKFKESRDDVQAPARVEQVIAKVRALAGNEGIEPDLVEALYRQMIARFISIELAAHRDDERTP